MAVKVCPHCGQEKDTRGFSVHVISCKDKTKMESLKKRYASQLQTMTPMAAERFLRKAGGLTCPMYR